MILADVPTPSPEFMGNWIFAGFAFLSIIGIAIAILSYFATRREVDELKTSNIKAWEKMESDRLEAVEKIKTVEGDLKAVRATMEAINNTVNLMNLKLDNIRSK